MKAILDINEAELAHIREYLTAQRRGDAFSADADYTIQEICRRVGFSASEDLPVKGREVGQCIVCGCTQKDACSDRDDWADVLHETVCSRCADA